jgi:probable phosphoglycerate mutase
MDDALELWLIRHGETTHSAGRRLAGWSDPPLTEIGRCEALALRAVLDGGRFDSVWSSDLDRALSTARLAWGEPRLDGRLREVNFGSLEGRGYDEVDAEFAEVFLRFRDFAVPGGETHREFTDRVRQFVEELPPGRHLLFVHGGVIRALTQDFGLDRFVGTGSLVRVDWRVPRIVSLHEPRAALL